MFALQRADIFPIGDLACAVNYAKTRQTGTPRNNEEEMLKNNQSGGGTIELSL